MCSDHKVIVHLKPCIFCIFLTPKNIVKKHNGKLTSYTGQDWIVSFPTKNNMKAFVNDAERRGYQCGYIVQLPTSNMDIVAGIHDQSAFFIPD